MAILKVLPHQAIIDGFKGKIDFYMHRGIACARKWPRSPGHLRAPAVMAQWPTFTEAAQGWVKLTEEERQAYRDLASGTGLSGRDLFTRSYIKGLLPYPIG
ncbi:unnamed protein product [marine sediment metagenome]|uniref:Uncharacterized protein n=1 Tax=marine sediment metagenome TaxID=412755 RepID=X1E3M2_9ZZZZ